MELDKQAGIVFRCYELGTIDHASFMNWVNTNYSKQEPPSWLLEKPFSHGPFGARVIHLADYHGITVTQNMDVCILAHANSKNIFLFEKLVSVLFQAFVHHKASESVQAEELWSILQEWDEASLPDLGSGNWKDRISKSLNEYERVHCGDYHKTITQLFEG